MVLMFNTTSIKVTRAATSLLLLLALCLGVVLPSPAQTFQVTPPLTLSPYYGPFPGMPTVVTNTTTNTMGSVYTNVSVTNINFGPVPYVYTTSNAASGIQTNYGTTNIWVTNVTVTLSSNYIVLGGAKTMGIWISGAGTNAGATDTVTATVALSPDGINWSSRKGNMLVTFTGVGLTATNNYTNLDVSEGAFAKILTLENPGTTFSYPLTFQYVLRP